VPKLVNILQPSDHLFLRAAFRRSQSSESTKSRVIGRPVARYLAERHTPVQGLVTSPKAGQSFVPVLIYVMAGPIIDRGQLVGAVGCTREKSMPALIPKI